MSTEPQGVPAAAPSASELPSASASPADGGVVDVNAQPDPSAAPAGEGSVEPQPDPTPEHRKPAYRFAELSQRARDAELRAARLEGELEATRRQSAPAPATPAAPAGPVAPDPNDRARYPLGDIDPQYIDDVIDYRTELKVNKTFESRDQAQKAATEQSVLVDRVRTAVSTIEQRIATEPAYAEGREYLFSIPEAKAQVVHDICATSEPALLSVYLARNSQQAAVLEQMSQVERRYALGEIVGTLKARQAAQAGRPATPAPSAAPASGAQPSPASGAQPALAPTPIVNGGGAAPIGAPPEGDMNAYREWRAKAFT